MLCAQQLVMLKKDGIGCTGEDSSGWGQHAFEVVLLGIGMGMGSIENMRKC